MSELTGKQWIAGVVKGECEAIFNARNPSTSETLAPDFSEATEAEVNEAMESAQGCFDEFRGLTPEERAGFLDAIADGIMELGEELLDRAHAETGLPMPRLTMERGRAVNQAKLFANLIREGSWVDARIDTGDPDRKPLPKPDVRRMLVPVGPIVVFGASNFPLAISVVGSDTVSALGAGCPVVVKAHPAHPGTCDLLARAVTEAARQAGMPKGVFSMLQGVTHETGLLLVQHPRTRAVAFTGSLRGGRALFDAAAARPEPIPVYAEMGSTNPVFILPGALKERGEQIAGGYVQSVTLGAGQFCTNPGLVFGRKSGEMSAFAEAVSQAAAEAAPATMLHAGIRKTFGLGLERIKAVSGIKLLSQSSQPADAGKTEAPCAIFATDSATYRTHPELAEENFGPSSVIVDCDSAEEMEAVAEGLEGHLTATVHGTPEDLEKHAPLIRILERKVGRLVVNGFPTGIEVCAAMHHGGSYPATTHSFFTSIGTASILRFVRPLCYQGFPQEALPPELRNDNPRKIWRLVNNERSRNTV